MSRAFSRGRPGWPLAFALALSVGHPHAQSVPDRPGCTLTINEADYGKAKPKKHKISAKWRPAQAGIMVNVEDSGKNDTPIALGWMAAGSGWIILDYTSDLYYRVDYGPGSAYTLDAMIPELAFKSCTWSGGGAPAKAR